MRKLTDSEIDKIKLLTENSVEVALIEPTANGLNKSIMDATIVVRSFLKRKQVHDYDAQAQGQGNKVHIGAFIIADDKLIPSISSLYRPTTKNGDPRIWFKNLGSFASANDILGIIEFEKCLYVLNITKTNIENLLADNKINPLKELLEEIQDKSNANAAELLELLDKISLRGPIRSELNADTAVGRTLEYLLGIKINSSKNPDYKGIELKSFRDSGKNRKTLFAQVPDWRQSTFKSSSEILEAFGYRRKGDFKLYCTVSAIVRNAQGLRLKIDGKLAQLIENSSKAFIGDFAVWSLELLHRRLLEKHNETFWIGASSIMINGTEHFHYRTVEHTKKPIVSQFDILIDQGLITLDHLIKKNESGKVVEKGPLFKIKPNALALLFPPSRIYKLGQSTSQK